MNQHKLSFDAMMAGAPTVLPFELTISLKPGFGEYVTDPGKSGSGVTVSIGRTGEAPRTEHYPNRYQAWSRVQSIQARYMGGVQS
jgi:DsbC/DsbD-like thiol-disulfide interchange protein